MLRDGGRGWRVLFVDDGSADATFACLLSEVGRRPWARVVRHPTNLGLGAALRTGFRYAESPIVCTVASKEEGITEMWDAVLRHRAHLETSGELERRRSARLLDELRTIVARSMEARAFELTAGDTFDALYQAVLARELDPYAAAEKVIGTVA